jgi:hypothetical protein
MIDTDRYTGHTDNWSIRYYEPTRKHEIITDGKEKRVCVLQYSAGWKEYQEKNAQLIADAPLLLEAYKRHQLKDCAITQAEHMRAQVGDNTWHYAMEVWLYPETHYWDYDEEGTVQLIERYITTNRDAWVKHWGEPSEVARKRCEE